jgi:hypothetical protein
MVIHPIPTARIRVRNATDERRASLETAHAYAVLSIAVARQYARESRWAELEKRLLGDVRTPEFDTRIAQLLDRFANVEVVYDLAPDRALPMPILPGVYASGTDTGIALAAEVWTLDAAARETALICSIVHAMATAAGFERWLDAYTDPCAEAFARLDPAAAQRSAPNLVYYARELLPVARSLEQVSYCTVRTIKCLEYWRGSSGGYSTDIYLNKNGSKVWPASRSSAISAPGESSLGAIEVKSRPSSWDTIEVWKDVWLLPDELQWTFAFSPDAEVISTAGGIPLRTADPGSYEAPGTDSRDSGSVNYRCTLTVESQQLESVSAAQPTHPPAGIVHDEL